MEQEDILYISQTLSNLTGIPVRVYKGEDEIGLFATTELVKDPFLLYLDHLKEEKKNISYFLTDNLYYYAIQKHQDYQIVIGPFRYFPAERQVLMNMAFRLDVKENELDAFLKSIYAINCMPLETVLLSLTSYNFILNHEKILLRDLMIQPEEQVKNVKTSTENNMEKYEITSARNSTKKIEETLARFVEEGNMDGFDAWIKEAPSIRAGQMSSDYMRQEKNTFIVTAAIYSRAAIRGGLDYNKALDMSDDYIARCEACRTYPEISNLSYTMMRDYIQKVHQIKYKASPLESKIATYVYNHLSKRISLDELCSYLYMTRSNLCLRFKKETGMSVNDFVLKKKIEEGQNLLNNSDKSISSIALYLGFSSQAHFSKVFREITGVSPLAYRQKKTSPLKA